LGSILLLAGLKIWNPKDHYSVRFRDSISGLEVGSTVKMKGVRVGQVENITIGGDVESVLVTLALNPGTPVPEDTQAVITSIGITGFQFIELTGGTSQAKRIPPNTPQSFIPTGKSVLANLTGKAENIAMKVEAVLNNLIPFTEEDNRVRFKRLLDNVDKLVVSWQVLSDGNGGRIQRMFENLDRGSQLLEKTALTVSKLAEKESANLENILTDAASATRNLQRILQGLNPQATLTSINNAAQSVRKRVEDPALTQATASLNTAATKLSNLTVELGKIIRLRDRQIGGIIDNLDRTSSFLKEFSRTIKERPSVLLRGESRKERSSD
jgi:phospholipid/cholesterol/gamma-HCH transport system substrate-binding protein